MREWLTLVGLEWRLEARQGATLATVALFTLGSAYLFSLALGAVEPRIWNALFWLVLLLSATNAAALQFRRELTYRYTYYHQLAPPLAHFAAKVTVSAVLLFAIGVLNWGALALLFGQPVRDLGLFVGTLALVAVGLALVLGFVAVLTARARGGAGLQAVLAFPLLVPLLLTAVKLGAVALRLVRQTSTAKDLALLGAVDLLAIGLAILLVPAIWREA